MTDTVEAVTAPAVDTADTTNPSGKCAANTNNNMSNNGLTPRISRQEYGKQLHP